MSSEFHFVSSFFTAKRHTMKKLVRNNILNIALVAFLAILVSDSYSQCSEIRAAGLVYCNDASVVNLSAEIVGKAGCGDVEWYSSAAIDVPIATGCDFTTPAVTGNIKYYVRDRTNQSQVINDQIGFDFTSPELTNPNITEFDGNIRTDFTPTQDFVLNTVDVQIANWNGRTPATIEVEVVNYSDATKSALLNVPVPGGTAYTPNEILTLTINYNFIAFDRYDIAVGVNSFNIFAFDGTPGTDIDYDAVFGPVVNVMASGPFDSRDTGIDGFGPFFNWDISAELDPGGCPKKEVNIVQRCIEICDDGIDNDGDTETDEACEAFSCDGKLLQSISNRLYEMSVSPVVFTEINDLPFGINSLGYSAADNKVYALIRDPGDPDDGKVVRIAGNGDFQVLDELITKDGVELGGGFAADIGSDGNYYFLEERRNAGNAIIGGTLYKFELTTLTELSRVEVNFNSRVADIAFNPENGNVYGIDGNAPKRLYEFDPDDGATTIYPEINYIDQNGTTLNNPAPGGVVGGIYFLPSGRMIAYGSFLGTNAQNDMIEIDLDDYPTTGNVLVVDQNRLVANSNDGASCPYTLYMSKTADVSSVEPEDEIIYTIEINNNTGFEAPLVTFRDSISDYLTITSINLNDLGNANITSGTGVGTKDLLIENVNIPTGLSTVQFTATVDPASICEDDIIFNQAELTNLSVALGLSSLSDDPNTLEENDPTAVDFEPTFVLTTPNITSNSPVCENDTLVLEDIDAVDNIVWNGPDSYLSNLTIDSIKNALPINSGEYLAFRDSAGCTSDTVRIQVVVNPNPTANISALPAFCTNETDTLNATSDIANSTFSWIENTTGLSVTNVFNPITSADNNQKYTVEVTSPATCKDTAEVDIIVNPIPTVVASPDQAICSGKSVEISASGADSYAWTPVASLNVANVALVTATPNATTTYTVEGTSSGCSNTDEVIITVNTGPNLIDPQGVSLCEGDNANLTMSGADSYIWSPGTGLNATTGATVETSTMSDITYKVVGSTVNGCKDSVEIDVVIVDRPDLVVTPDTAVCEGASITLIASGAADYLWSPAIDLNATNISTVLSTPTAQRVYKVIGNPNSTSCRDSMTVTVSVNSQPSLTLSPDTAICNGSTANLTVSGAENYTWSPSNDLDNPNSDNVVFDGENTRTYEVTGVNTGGCEDSKMVTVTVNTVPDVTVSDDETICRGENVDLMASGADMFVWSPATGLDFTNVANVNSSAQNTVNYLIIGENNSGCKDSAEVEVRVLDNPVPSVTIEKEDVCEGEDITFRIVESEFLGDNPIFRWFDQGTSATLGNNEELVLQNQFVTSTIILEVTSNEKCVAPANVIVPSNSVTPQIFPFPDLVISSVDDICKEDQVSLTVMDNNNLATSYKWVNIADNSVYASQSNVLNLGLVSSTQDIRVVATENGCADSISTKINVVNVTVDISADKNKILQGDPVTVSVSSSSSNVIAGSDEDPGFSWTTNEGSEIRKPDETAFYYATASLGTCSATDTVKVIVIGSLNAPYFFSPNGDDNNDTWIVEELDNYDNTRVTIFNRWGSKIITLGDQENVWNGLYRSGEPVPEGVYYYVIEGEAGDRKVSLTGYVTIAK